MKRNRLSSSKFEKSTRCKVVFGNFNLILLLRSRPAPLRRIGNVAFCSRLPESRELSLPGFREIGN